MLGVNTPFAAGQSRAQQAALETDLMVPATMDLEYLVQRGKKVTMYYGEYDLLCNYDHGMATLDSLDWIGKEQWKETPVLNCEFGACKEVRNLRFVKFRKAGHSAWLLPGGDKDLCLKMMDELVDKE